MISILVVSLLRLYLLSLILVSNYSNMENDNKTKRQTKHAKITTDRTNTKKGTWEKQKTGKNGEEQHNEKRL